jgi:hypothetical protein
MIAVNNKFPFFVVKSSSENQFPKDPNRENTPFTDWKDMGLKLTVN